VFQLCTIEQIYIGNNVVWSYLSFTSLQLKKINQDISAITLPPIILYLSPFFLT